MPANAALRRFIHAANGVVAAGGTGRPFVQVGHEVLFGRSVRGFLSVFQRPLLFGGVKLTEVVDAGVLLCRAAGFDEVWDGDGA